MASGSCNHCFKSAAKAFKELGEESLIQYMESVWEDSSMLPKLKDEKIWSVQLWYKPFSHYSMLFTVSNCNEGFLVHLKKDENYTNVKFVIEVADLRHEKYKSLNKKSLGTTRPITAHDVITKAHDRLAKMGDYHAVLNNCQDYCQKVAKDLGLDVFLTDFDGTASAAATGVLAAVIGFIIKAK